MIKSELVEKLARRRIRLQFPDLDLTGLSSTFPFEPTDIKTLSNERSIRLCLKAMAKPVFSSCGSWLVRGRLPGERDEDVE